MMLSMRSSRRAKRGWEGTAEGDVRGNGSVRDYSRGCATRHEEDVAGMEEPSDE